MRDEEVRAGVLAELEKARAEFHALYNSLTEEDFRRRSLNPGWTNGEVLFHITLGFMLLPVLIPVMKLFGRLPMGVSKAFAGALNFSTPFFNWINGLGPRGGAKVYSMEKMSRKFDRTLDAVRRTADSVKPHQWALRMHMPNRWDPMFGETRTIEGAFYYMTGHMRFHFGQIAQQ